MARPKILVTNDDSITAPGIRNLMEVATEFGDVTVVAPDSPQSGMGHAISIGRPLRLYRKDLRVDVEAWACSGTPADCVKLARAEIFHEAPDFILSGINHGANSSISVLYSGTMSAAMEGAIENIPSIGFSLANFSEAADFTASREVVRRVMRQVLDKPWPLRTALNVNIPNVGASELKGIKVARQSHGRFVEEFDKRTDPYSRPYYWLTGSFELDDKGADTDTYALEQGYASIVPCQVDLTNHALLDTLRGWSLEVGL